MLSSSQPDLSAPALILLTALGYVVATVGMKSASVGWLVPGAVLGVAGFAAAFAAEVVLMRQTHLSVLYIAILGVETILILALAFGLGEGFTTRQAAGAVLVVAGLVVVAT